MRLRRQGLTELGGRPCFLPSVEINLITAENTASNPNLHPIAKIGKLIVFSSCMRFETNTLSLRLSTKNYYCNLNPN
jgi:hypothetical protein